MTGPEKKFRAGGCTAAVFVNQFQTPEGLRTAKNVVLERTYKDKTGAFQVGKSFSMNDIPKAILVLQEAYAYIALNPVKTEPNMVPKVQQHLSGEPSF